MRKGTGIVCIFLGVLCLLGALALVGYNRWESRNAAATTRTFVESVRQSMEEGGSRVSQSEGAEQTGEEETGISDPISVPDHMPTIEVDGYDCIGILSVPVLELELPVLTPWSYTKLRKAPCHYYGSYYEKDFVIAAHNYPSHFGRLGELQPGDLVVFTDVNGEVYPYEVVLLETLPPEATEEMITSGFDLSLYTCTAGGGSRVTVRCNRK